MPTQKEMIQSIFEAITPKKSTGQEKGRELRERLKAEILRDELKKR